MRASEAEKHPRVTTHCRYGGIGLGRIVNGIVYKSAGNGFYIPAADDVTGLESYDMDDGAGYLQVIKRIAPNYLRTR